MRLLVHNTVNWGRGIALLVLTGLAVTCASHPPPPQGPAPVVSGVATGDPPPARSARAITPGKIRCAATECELKSEICCFDEESQVGSCVAKSGAEGGRCPEGLLARSCDESRDCAEGSSCCQDIVFDDECRGEQRWSCRAGTCGASSVLSDEVCLPGASCEAGACALPTTEGGDHGFCPSTKLGLPCGEQLCAKGQGCCWDAGAKRGSCVSEGERCQEETSRGPSARRELFWCRGSVDCGEGFECFSATGSADYQEYACGHSRCHPLTTLLGPFLCSTLDDCPESFDRPVSAGGDEYVTYKLTGCEADASAPGGAKRCGYK